MECDGGDGDGDSNSDCSSSNGHDDDSGGGDGGGGLYSIHMEICMLFKICFVSSKPIYLQSKNSNDDEKTSK